ncbi:MAG: DNA primase small subunit domain-containing protein [Candidatus Woesearchaeota archaeon]
MIDIGTVLRHYKREDIQNELVLHSKNKELVGSFKGEGYAKRPDTLTYPRDVLELVKQGITSFHASEEIWSNPLQLDPLLKKQEIEALRIGWDLVIDIDCPYWPYSKLITDLVIKALKHYNIEAVSVKFSGNKGFHIGVPFEAFPQKIGENETSKMFPDYIRLLALYLKEMIKNVFLKKVLEMENNNIEKIASNLKKTLEKLSVGGKVDPEKMIDIDTILISGRHLYRAPYSLHEKSGLCSIPIDPNKVMEFEKEQALPSTVKIDKKLGFLNRENIQPNQAKELFDKATEMMVVKKSKEEFEHKETEYKEDIPQEAIPEQFFPPCVKHMLSGLEDGRKRALFILNNFLSSVGWEYDKIEPRLKEWNKANKEPLREVILLGQLRYRKQQKKKILPPNCQNSMYYKDFNACHPDNLCNRIKNPVQYSKRKTYFLNNNKTQKKNDN